MRVLNEKAVVPAAVALVLLGCIVCVAWLLHFEPLTRIVPGGAPMQFNTALLFAVFGLSMLSLHADRPRLTIAGSAAVGIFATLTLAQYLWGLNFGIDELFVRGYVLTQTSHPGRMAPNTAVAFILSSAALLLLARRQVLFASAALAAIVLVLATTALAGYIVGISSAYGWGQLTRMAVHTAAAFCLVGGSLIVTVAARMNARRWIELPWIGALCGVLVAGFSLTIWQALQNERDQSWAKELTRRAEASAERYAGRVLEWTYAFDRMARRYAEGVYEDELIWQIDASTYLAQMPGLGRLAIEDMHGSLTARAMLLPGDAVASANTYITPATESDLGDAQAAYWRASANADQLRIVLQRSGRRSDRVRLAAWISTPAFIATERRLLRDQGFDLMVLPASRELPPQPWAQQVPIPHPLEDLSIRIAPLTAAQGYASRMPDLLLVAGIVVALLLALTLSQAQQLKRAKELAEDSVSKLFQTSKELERLATVDPLTGAYNRRYFLARLQMEIDVAQRSRRPMSVMIMDLDHFKSVNDRYGHGGGDEVLQAFVAAAGKVLRPGGTLARYGGEEFAALLPDADGASGLRVAKRICAAAQDLKLTLKGDLLAITVSIGVAQLGPEPAAATADALLALADIRLYEAKAQGRNRAVGDSCSA